MQIVNVIVGIVILVISFILALRSLGEEMSVPDEVKNLRIRKDRGVSGVILFLKEKILHYVQSGRESREKK